MSLLHQKHMSGRNIPHWVVIVRIVLGVCLIYKGIDFIQHKGDLEAYFSSSGALKNMLWAIHIVPWIHIIGGVMILVGFFTRFMSLIQIPIVLGAVIFVNINESDKGAQSELPFSFLMLVLIIVFVVEGGGFMSLDNYLRKPVNMEDELVYPDDDEIVAEDI